MSQFLLDRFFDTKNHERPAFAFQSTINWMRGLALIVNSSLYTEECLSETFAKVNRRKVNKEADNFVFENVLMALHYLASLHSMNHDVKHQYNTCRSAIIAWYYSTYFSCRAMISGASGTPKETHSLNAKVWHRDIVENKLLPYPFNLHLSSLVKKKVKSEIKEYRQNNTYNLDTYPQDREQAYGAIVSYLSGTADYQREKIIEKKVKKDSKFKELNVKNFRTKKAQEIRDESLDKEKVNFLTQAFRYRGKANYRDSIFLSYGNHKEEKIKQFTQDLLDVTTEFLRMASYYSARRVEKGMWDLFVKDIEDNSRLSIGTEVLKYRKSR